MKKLTVIFIILLMFGTPSFADDVTVTDEDTFESLNAEDFIPNSVTDSLLNNKIEIDSEKTAKSVSGFVLNTLKSISGEISGKISVLFVILLFMSIFYKIIDNTLFKTIIAYISALSVLIEVFSIIRESVTGVTECLEAVSNILSAVLPAFSAVLLMGGGTFSAVSQGASFSAVIALLSYALTTLIMPAVTVLSLILVFEKVSPQFAELNLLKFLKKNIITAITFITMIMLTVISYQNIVSAGRDSVSGRTVKFAAANFIPIVGAAFGESLRTVGAGLKYVKNTVGCAVGLSITVTVLPALLRLILVKITFNFLSFVAGLSGCKGEQSLIESSVFILDILNAIIICSAILSLFLIIFFVIITFPIAS